MDRTMVLCWEIKDIIGAPVCTCREKKKPMRVIYYQRASKWSSFMFSPTVERFPTRAPLIPFLFQCHND